MFKGNRMDFVIKLKDEFHGYYAGAFLQKKTFL